jgi:PKD repeat protein
MIAAVIMMVGNPTGGGGGSAPTASFTWVPQPAKQGTLISFINTSSGSDPKTFSWTIAGNQFSTQENPTYYPSNFGTLVVGLTATNQYGSNTTSNNVGVMPAG